MYQQFKTLYKAHQYLVLSVVFSGVLLFARVLYTGKITFVFLVWNLLLAVLPLVFSYRLSLDRPTRLNFLKAMLCLLFLPNAPYILTDLFHIKGGLTVMLWFDTLLIASFAWCGMLCFFYSLRNIENFLNAIFSKRFIQAVILMLCFSSGFGIYIGRFLRFNSWDIVQQPFYLISSLLEIVLHPTIHPRAWGFTLLYGLFLYITYQPFKSKKPDAVSVTPTNN